MPVLTSHDRVGPRVETDAVTSVAISLNLHNAFGAGEWVLPFDECPSSPSAMTSKPPASGASEVRIATSGVCHTRSADGSVVPAAHGMPLAMLVLASHDRRMSGGA